MNTPLLGNSQIVTSNQSSIHPDLESIVKKNQKHKYLKPFKANQELNNIISYLKERYPTTSKNIYSPIVLDTGCGTGESSISLATMYPEKFVIGFDKSSHRLSKPKDPLPSNLLITQQVCEEVWSKLAQHGIRCETYLLYPNPWPKKKHVKRRWHSHPIFPTLLEISTSITMRTNWRIYAVEFSLALAIHKIPHKLTPLPPQIKHLSPFERKYTASNHTIFQATTK